MTLPEEAVMCSCLCGETDFEQNYEQLTNYIHRKNSAPKSTEEFQIRSIPSTSLIYINTEHLNGLFDCSPKTINELFEVYNEADDEDWDGYEANAISREAFIEANKLIRMLPSSLPLPEIVPEPDGGIGFEWYKDKGFVFVASVYGNNIITYAGLFGKNREIHGKEEFIDSIPNMIITAIKQLFE
jgi:hypothetical protein